MAFAKRHRRELSGSRPSAEGRLAKVVLNEPGAAREMVYACKGFEAGAVAKRMRAKDG